MSDGPETPAAAPPIAAGAAPETAAAPDVSAAANEDGASQAPAPVASTSEAGAAPAPTAAPNTSAAPQPEVAAASVAPVARADSANGTLKMSIKTEESAGTEDSASEDSSTDDDDSSDGSSSSSSEDPSVIPGDIENQNPPPMHLRKSPPETQGVCPNSPGSVVSDRSEDQAEAVLTKEELLALQDAAEAAAQGNAFYSAYGDVAGEWALPIDSSHRSRRTSRRGSKIGQDRASVRSMVAQRMVGRGYDRSGRRGAASRRGSGKRSVPVNRDIAAMADEMERSGSSSHGWTSTKKRRVLYALLAVAVGIVGISLIAYGVGKQQEYNHQEDEGADDSAVENDAPSPSAPAPSTPTPPSTFTGLTAQPATESPVMGSDDALLTLLKRGYADAFGMIEGDTSGLLADAVGRLDHAAQSGLPAEAQSVQWRVYDYMANQRSDVIAKGANALLMDDERILQIFALGVFYETFGWEIEGEDECQWLGVACRGLGMHAELDDVDPDNLRVVALNVKGEGPGGAGEDGPFGPLLEGELPIELMFLRHLETLDLSHNFISGRLRGEMFHFKNMKVLELNDNRLEGAIPPELGSMYNLQKLTLHHNEFTGTVPAEVCTLRVTRVLHFLWADCSPMPVTNVPKVDCPIENCCSICFEGYDADGGPSTGGSSPPAQGGKIDTPHNVQNDGGSSIKTKLSEASTDGGAALLDISSPQFRAYAWLVEDSNGSPGGYSDRRLLQRYALATLFDSTNGEHWARSDNWMTAADECEWFGISGCNGAKPDDIVTIELSENKLRGKIPPELFEFLPDIAKLNLATNALTGAVPTEIGLLNEINILELAVNKLTGTIPTQLGDLPSLDHLFLQYNEFDRGQSMPEQVCNLRNAGSMTLLWADCREGQGSSVQCEPTCCTTCFEGGSDLFGGHSANDIHSDEATTHADSSGEVLATLKKMAPDGGTSLDDSLSPQVKAYSWLVGVDGQLNGLSDVQLLQRYALATVYFSTSGHGWIKEEAWLTDADACEWEMVLECNADGMATKVDLSGNNLVGQIPVEITHLRSLELLDLTDNEIYGSIPTEFGWFEDMEVLRLGGNLLSGDIPAELGNLHTMHELYIHDNDFSEGASVPYEVCALRSVDGTGLSTLWADCAGDWPAVFCEESCCDECFDDESDFIPYGGHQTGFFSPKTPPPVFSGSATIIPGREFPPTAAPVLSAPTLPENPALKADLLQHMSGFEENLSDPNSPAYQAYLWLANSKGFEELDLSRKLQRFGLVAFYKSTTPDYDWKVSNRWQTHQHECGWFGITCAVDDTVTEISLPRNRMSGSIPPEIALVGLGGQLGKLDLSGNHIGGELPEQLGTLTHLEMLDLRNNDFTGPIPPELGQLSMLKSLALQANELSGDMPKQICSLAIGSGLVELIADCDPADPFSKVSCDVDTCCTHCD